jgi:hypothetical protein
MFKKLRLLALLAGLLAVAVPAMAQASTGITQPTNVLLAVGTEVAVESTDMEVATSAGIVTCATAKGIVKLTKNSASAGVEGVAMAAGSTTGCLLGGSPITVSSLKLSPLISTSTSSGSGTLGVSFQIVSGGTCMYTASAAPFTYTANGSAIHISDIGMTANPMTCPAAKLFADFTLRRSGSAVFVM